MKLPLQKRTNNKDWWGNLLEWYYYGIVVGTKWQSSLVSGDYTITLLNGNGIFGNEYVRVREILLDLRPKINHINNH